MPNFDKTWARQESPGVTDKLRETIKPQGALKPRIQTAVNKLQEIGRASCRERV